MTRKTSSKRQKAPEPERLSRLQICQKYSITEDTLRLVIDEAGLVALESERVHGRVLYKITEDDAKVLQAARLCPHSIATFRPPSLRYIMYMLLIGTVNEAYDGLGMRQLTSARVNRTAVEAIKTAMVAAAPKSLEPYIGTGKIPSKSVMADFELVLDILALSVVYENPETIDDLFFPNLRMVHFMNQLVSTHSCTDIGRAGVVEKAVGHPVITAAGVMMYRSLFHDIGFMRERDLDIYLAGLNPSTRGAYRRAIELTTADFAIESQLFTENLVEYQYMSRELRKKARELITSSSREDLAAAGHVITTIRQIDDFVGKLRPDDRPKETPSFLRDVTLAEYDFDAELPHLKGIDVAQSEDVG